MELELKDILLIIALVLSGNTGVAATLLKKAKEKNKKLRTSAIRWNDPMPVKAQAMEKGLRIITWVLAGAAITFGIAVCILYLVKYLTV